MPINHVAEPTEVETVPLSSLTPESANLPMALSGMVEHGDSQDYSPRMFDKYPGILYVHQQNLPGLYRILCHQVQCHVKAIAVAGITCARALAPV